MDRTIGWIAVFCLVGGIIPAGRADEVDDLVTKLKPEVRFRDHTPDFSVEKKTFTFHQMPTENNPSGKTQWPFWVIKDGRKHVAIVCIKGFHSGTVYLLTHDPTKASTKLEMPTERWHIDTAIGSEIRTDCFIPPSEGDKDKTYDWSKGGETLTLVRRFKGKAKYYKWPNAHRRKMDQTIDTTNTIVLRCDPVFGYVVEATFDSKAKPIPRRIEYVSAAPAGRYSLWPGTETCYRTAITPEGEKGYSGYYLNLAAIDLCDNNRKKFRCRDGGFASFLNDKTGWSPTTTLDGGVANLVVCNAHADVDFDVQWPKVKPDGQGMGHLVVKHRLLFLPPKLTRHVWDRMEVRFKDLRKVAIRLGDTETFEDQPLPLTTRVRGLSFAGPGPKITTDDAHSGKRSMVVDGRVWPNLPQIALKPNTRYHMEAWIKVTPWSETQKKQHLEKIRKDNLKREEKGKPLREVPDIDDLKARAYIRGDFYQWTPHSPDRAKRQQTSDALPGKGWQKVTLDFTTPRWGPFIDVVFVCENGTALVDDFVLRPEESEATSALAE